MKKLINLVALALIAVLLLACGQTYTIRTKDGREFQSKARPDLTDDRYVKFKTKAGQKVLLKQDEVSVISED